MGIGIAAKFNWFSRLSLGVGLCFFGSWSVGAVPAYQFDHIEETTIYFNQASKSPPLQSIPTGISDLKYLGILNSSENAPPYFLMSGKNCETCEEDQAIYLISPTGKKPSRFVYPGKILDPRTRGILIKSRAFFGKCLNSRKNDVLVVFQDEKVDRRAHPQSSVLVVEAAEPHPKENLLERTLPSIHATLKKVKGKTCAEIEGRNRLMADRPLDLHGHADEKGEEKDESKSEQKDAAD